MGKLGSMSTSRLRNSGNEQELSRPGGIASEVAASTSQGERRFQVKDNRTAEVREISKINFTGNVIPHTWWTSVKTEDGNTDWLGVCILAEVCYWYRERVIRDETTGAITGRVKRFDADLLQKNYCALAEQFGTTVRHAKNAVARLEKSGLLVRCIRTVKVQGRPVPNVLFLKPNPQKIEQLNEGDTTAQGGDTTLLGVQPPTPRSVTLPSQECNSTEITTETSTEREDSCANAPSPKLQKPEAKPQEASPSQAAASQAQEAYALWQGHYNAAFPAEPYFCGTSKRRKADLAAMRALVESGRTPEQIGEVARRMFAAAKQAVNGKRVWWSEHCKTAFNFGEHWNEIVGELGPVAGSTSGTSTVSPAISDKFLRRWTRDQGPVREEFRDDSSFRAHAQAWRQWAEAKA